jgi:RHS repeat-associated protein
VTYKLDAWGNRIERGQTGTTPSTQRYVVDGWDTAKPAAVGTEGFETVMDLDGGNSVTSRRVFGAGFDNAVARQDAGGGVSWYAADAQGSVRQVLDNSGNTIGSRAFTGFGAVTATTGTGHDRYAFTGTVTDPLTGLVGDDARQYDPTLGKWTSDDPIGFGGGDPNLSRYVANGPTTATDPSGLKDDDTWKNLWAMTQFGAVELGGKIIREHFRGEQLNQQIQANAAAAGRPAPNLGPGTGQIMAEAVGSGLKTGGKGVVNAGGQMLLSLITIGFDDDIRKSMGYTGPWRPLALDQEDIDNGQYEASEGFARVGWEMLMSVATAGLGSVPLLMSKAGDLVQLGKGIYDIKQSGLNWGNGLTVSLGLIGLLPGGRGVRGGSKVLQAADDIPTTKAMPKGATSATSDIGRCESRMVHGSVGGEGISGGNRPRTNLPEDGFIGTPPKERATPKSATPPAQPAPPAAPPAPATPLVPNKQAAVEVGGKWIDPRTGKQDWVKPKGWQLPQNGTWDGTPGHSNFKPNNPAELGLKPGEVVPFRNGYPDFSKWTKETFTAKKQLTGNPQKDQKIMIQTVAEAKGWTQKKTQKWLATADGDGYSLHHAGGDTIQLVPSRLHGNKMAKPPLTGLHHQGGAHNLRKTK